MGTIPCSTDRIDVFSVVSCVRSSRAAISDFLECFSGRSFTLSVFECHVRFERIFASKILTWAVAVTTKGQLQTCKDLYRCSKTFCNDFPGKFFRTFESNYVFQFLLLQQVFQLIKTQPVETLRHSKFCSRKTCPHQRNFGVRGMFGIGTHGNLSISIELSTRGPVSTLRGSSAILISFWWM